MSDYSPGLAGVIAGDTKISRVDVEKKQLFYRGFDINTLCDHSHFMEVAYLLIHGELPSSDELLRFTQSEASQRELPTELISFMKMIPKETSYMDILRSMVGMLGMYSKHDCDYDNAMSCLAKIPTHQCFLPIITRSRNHCS